MKQLQKMFLHEYQKDMVERICKQPKIALWLDLGLGKTIISLQAICKLIGEGSVKKALVIAPKTVTESVWKQESETWQLPLRVSVVTGNAKQREKALQVTADVYVISRDNLAWLFQQSFDADMLIVDESTSFKDRSTQRWASLCQKTIHVAGKKISRKQTIISMFKRVVLLSATPASENYAGLWSQVALLYPTNNPLGNTITAFRNAYMVPSFFGGSMYPQYVKMQPGAIERINEKLKGICVSMRKEDYLQLPERIDIIRKLNGVNEHYNRMAKHGVIHINNMDIIAGDVLTKYGKLQQLSSGFIYDEQGGIHVVNKIKEQALQDLLEYTQENILVMYRYEYEKKMLQNMGGVPLDNPESIAEWKQGKIRIGILYPASGGYGLNLASGGNVIIWYTLPLSLEQYIQANGRIHRQGQTKPVRIYHLLATPMDEHIYKLLQSKCDVLNGLLKEFKV